MLEPCEGKLSRTVLRGEGGGNASDPLSRKEGETMVMMKADMEESNPRLKAMFLEVVENQLKSDDPAEARKTLERLIANGMSREDAMIYIAQAVCVEVFTILKDKKPFDHERYVRNLAALPEEPKE